MCSSYRRPLRLIVLTNSRIPHIIPMRTESAEPPSMLSLPEHEANTERLITKHTSMRHVEGGWPKDVDFTEQVDSKS